MMSGGVLGGLATLAVLPLPASRRLRYREEFLFELLALRPQERLGHALRLLANAWKLRGALTETMPSQMPGDAEEPPESGSPIAPAGVDDEQSFVGLVNSLTSGPWWVSAAARRPKR